MNLPKRGELSLRIVRALPNDSSIGFDCRTCCSTPFLEEESEDEDLEGERERLYSLSVKAFKSWSDFSSSAASLRFVSLSS